MLLWGTGVAAQGSLTHALVAGAVAAGKRSSAFGIFDAAAGVAWFAGSWLMDVLYSQGIGLLVCFSVSAQLVSLPLFLFGERRR